MLNNWSEKNLNLSCKRNWQRNDDAESKNAIDYNVNPPIQPIYKILRLFPSFSRYLCHQFLQYFTEERVSIGLKNKLRMGTSIP